MQSVMQVIKSSSSHRQIDIDRRNFRREAEAFVDQVAQFRWETVQHRDNLRKRVRLMKSECMMCELRWDYELI